MSKIAFVAANLTTEMQQAAITHLTMLEGKARPVEAVRSLVTEFPLLSRVEVIAIATSKGINRHTANTQYQHVRAAL